MGRRKLSFIVTVNVRYSDISDRLIEGYIRDAVRGWKGGYMDDNPISFMQGRDFTVLPLSGTQTGRFSGRKCNSTERRKTL